MYEKDKSVTKVTNIKITFNPENNNFSVYNDSDGISTDINQKKNPYSTHFGELLTSSNYKKDEKKIVGGKNGNGAK